MVLYVYMAQPYLSIIIPAYNEAERIPATLVDMDKRLSGVDYSYEILVVNDGSKDNTATVVKNMAKMVKSLKLIDFQATSARAARSSRGCCLPPATSGFLPTPTIPPQSISLKK